MTQGPAVVIDLHSIVGNALMRAANDQLRKVDGASAVDYVVADVTEALRKMSVIVQRPWETKPDLVPVSENAEGRTVEGEASETIGGHE